MTGISTPGRIDSFLESSHVKRTRYAHHVTLSVLLQLQRAAFQCSVLRGVEGKKDGWLRNGTHWFTVIDFIVMLFMFVRSLRKSNIRLYMQILSKMLPWFFALDHINYSRWLTFYSCRLTQSAKRNWSLQRILTREVHGKQNWQCFPQWEKIRHTTIS